MSKRKTYIEKMEKQIRQWDKEMDDLLAEAGKTKSKLKGEYKSAIAKINTRKAAAVKHLEELERELIANFGIRTGLVYRAIRDRYSSYNAAQPFASFNVPVQIPDPGPDGVTGTSDDGPSIAGFNLDPTLVGVASRNVLANAPAKNDYYTFEISGNKRMSHRWSLMVAYTQRWNHDDASSIFGNSTRANTLPRTPNDLINTADDDTYHYTTWAFKVHSMIEAPWGLRLTPMLRHYLEVKAAHPDGLLFYRMGDFLPFSM